MAESVPELISAAIETISDGFALLDADGRFIMINAPFRRLYPKSADALVVGGSYEAFARRMAISEGMADDNDGVETYVRERMALIANPGQPFEFRMPDGRWIRVADYRAADGGMVCVRTDITERKQREQALAESQDRFRRLSEITFEAVFILNGGIIVDHNLAAVKVSGYSPSELMGMSTLDLLAPEYRALAAERIANRDERSYVAEGIRKDGSRLPVELHFRHVEDNGESLRVVAVRDITERREAEKAMAEQRERLHQSHKLGALGSLLAGVAHELNNPLSIVVAQAMLLEETAADPRSLDRGRRIRAAAERCSKIVRSFLAMARQRPPQRAAVDIGQVIEDVTALVGYGLRTSGIEVVRAVMPGLPPVMADPDQLNQVLTNLMVNAQQALEGVDGPRRIVVSAECDGKTMAVTVADNGPGVPAEIRDRIFEPFYTTKPVGLGTGVGLAVCHGIIESYGGSIAVGDAPGGGAMFEVTLPLGEQVEARISGKETVATAPSRRRILVVDDEAEIAATLAEILQHVEHDVDVADSGAAALELIARNRYDLVLTDLRMPGMDGVELHRRLRAERPELANRIVVVTGDTLNGTARAFLEDTNLPRLEKPFSPAEARRIVALALAGL